MTTLANINNGFISDQDLSHVTWVVKAHRPAQDDYVRECYMGGSEEENKTRQFSSFEEAAQWCVELQQINVDKENSNRRYEVADWEWEIKLSYFLPGLDDLEWEANKRLADLKNAAWKEHLAKKAEAERLAAEEKARKDKEEEEARKVQQEVRERALLETLKQKYKE